MGGLFSFVVILLVIKHSKTQQIQTKIKGYKKAKTLLFSRVLAFLVERGGFEPPKSLTTDLQSAPFGHSGTSPLELVIGIEPTTY